MSPIPGIGYNAYSTFLKQKFGTRIHKVPVNAGFTCPNRDGTVATGGCTYCNIDSYTPEAARARVPVRQQVHAGIEYLKQRSNARAFIAYFQPYTNTYADLDHLKHLFEQALDHPDVVGISIGTRPDCIEEDKLRYLEKLARDTFVTLEFGIESVFDETLRLINRGHDFACTVDGIRRAANRGIHICAHIILGFPNETEAQMLHTADVISTLPIDFVKIHNLHVVRYTELARQYQQQPFHIFTFDEWIELVCKFLERLNPEFVVERLYGDAPKKLLIEPQWCRDGAKIIYAVQQKLKERETYQGKCFKPPSQTGTPVSDSAFVSFTNP